MGHDRRDNRLACSQARRNHAHIRTECLFRCPYPEILCSLHNEPSFDYGLDCYTGGSRSSRWDVSREFGSETEEGEFFDMACKIPRNIA